MESKENPTNNCMHYMHKGCTYLYTYLGLISGRNVNDNIFPNILCGFISEYILQSTYDIRKNNWIRTFHNLLFTDKRRKSNHKTIELLYATFVYTLSFNIY